MDAAEWLEKFEPAFASLSAEERKEMDDFSRLWGYYEGSNLGADANTRSIILSVAELKERGLLTLEPVR